MNLKCYQLEINNLVSEILTKNFSRRVLFHDRRDYQNDIMEKVIRQGLVHDERKGCLRAWVYSIVRNHIIDQERKYQKRKLYYTDKLSHYESPDDGTELLEKEELEAQFYLYDQLIEQETEQNKKIMDLFYFQHCSNKEVAKALSISESGLAMARNRIKKRLKKNAINGYLKQKYKQ
jgi:RNA polymerase sigma factor (sigma-70 family)